MRVASRSECRGATRSYSERRAQLVRLYRRVLWFSAFEHGRSSGDSSDCWRFHGRRTSRSWRRAGGVVHLGRQAQQHSAHSHLQSIKRLHKRRMMREILCFKADLGKYLWHLAQQVECFPVQLLQVNPETKERNDGVVGELPAPFRCNGFASATNSIFS